MLYDFDVVTTEVGKSSTGIEMAALSSNNNSAEKTKPTARFRYKETADAAAIAPPAVRLFLEDLGFGFTNHDSRAPAGCYDEKDDAVRLQLIEKMTQLLSNRALRKALDRAKGQGIFDVSAFMTCVVIAKPVSRVVPRRPNQLARKAAADERKVALRFQRQKAR